MSQPIDDIRIDLKLKAPQGAAQKITDIADALEDLNDVGKRLKIQPVIDLFNSMANAGEHSAGRLATAITNITNSLYMLDTVSGRINITGITSMIDGMARAAAGLSAETADRLKAIASVMESYRSLGDMTQSVPSQTAESEVTAIGDAAENTAEKTETALDKVNSKLRRTALVASAVSRGIGNAFKWVAKAIANVALTIGSAFGKALKSLGERTFGRIKQFISRVKNILIYRLIKAVIKEVKDAFKTGMTNMYYYSQEMGTQFAKSMDMIATSMLYLKNSIGAMVAPIVNTLAPAIDMIVDKFVDFLNVINQVIATLSGASTWTKALKYPYSYEESLGNANKKAKELRATLLSIDEINRLDDNNKGSGGSGNDALDYSRMFEEQVLDSNKWTEVAANIRDAFKKKDFVSIGSNIGKWIKEGLDSKNWTELGEKITRFPQNVIDVIRGIVEEPGFFDSLGDAFSDALSGVVNVITFNAPKNGETFGKLVSGIVTALKKIFKDKEKWKELGTALGTMVNNIVNEVNGDDVGELLSGVFEDALEFFKNFLSTTGFPDVVKKVEEAVTSFFTTTKWIDVGSSLSYIFANILDGIFELSGADIGEIAAKIAEAIVNIVSSIDWIGLALRLAKVILNAIFSIPQVLLSIIEGLWKGVTRILGQMFVNLGLVSQADVDKAISAIGDLGGAVRGWFDGVVQAAGAGIDMAISEWEKFQKGEGGAISDALDPLKKELFKKDAEAQGMIVPEIHAGYSGFLTTNGQYNTPNKSALSETATKEAEDWVKAIQNTLTSDETKASMEKTGKVVTSSLKLSSQATKQAEDYVKSLNASLTSDKAKTSYENDGKTIGEKIWDGIKDRMNHKGLKFDLLGDEVGVKTSAIARAGGGVVNSGQMFLANEAGPEFIGNIGRTTAVANTSQMVDAIAGGVAMAETEGNMLLRELLTIGRGLLAKDTSVEITTSGLTSALRRGNQVAGRTLVPIGG